ncbi:MAG: hypothetical protein HYY23_18335 [Verrucomicrobia bacterium]|nr:hypothetical protein [Verrucomicrobiota bacterium]
MNYATMRPEQEIKSHDAPHQPSGKRVPVAENSIAANAGSTGADKVKFKVRLDQLGHMMIECWRGDERVETGLRGLPSLVNSGLMRKPKRIHVDPLQRAIEIDHFRIECDELGVQQLEGVLNSRYAPVVRPEDINLIEIKENAASSTGFDIKFVENCAGARVEIKGHLCQENLDLLQDASRCDLLQPGIVMRLSPPNLLIRRRNSSGMEERIPGLPDIQYRRVTPVQLQRILNHPQVHRKGNSSGITKTSTEHDRPAKIREMLLTKNPQNCLHLWLECFTEREGEVEGMAFTHHNVAELQHRGAFRDDLDVTLSFDHSKFSILNKRTNREQTIAVDLESSEADLAKASRILTAALKSPSRNAGRDGRSDRAAAVNPAKLLPEVPAPATAAAPLPATADRASTLESQMPPQPQCHVDPRISRVFQEADPQRINVEIFQGLAQRLGLPIQDVRLSLERVFENRRFEALSYHHAEISSVMELRSAEFYGFYLSHINENKILLVYGCKGRHIEFGSENCTLQASIAAEPCVFKDGGALLGLAQNRNNAFVFIVSTAFKYWVKAREKLYEDAQASFATVEDIAREPEKYSLIWPVLSAGQFDLVRANPG